MTSSTVAGLVVAQADENAKQAARNLKQAEEYLARARGAFRTAEVDLDVARRAMSAAKHLQIKAREDGVEPAIPLASQDKGWS